MALGSAVSAGAGATTGSRSAFRGGGGLNNEGETFLGMSPLFDNHFLDKNIVYDNWVC